MAASARSLGSSYPRNQAAPWRGLGVYMAKVGRRLRTEEPLSFEGVVQAHRDAYSAYKDEQMLQTMQRLCDRGIAQGALETGWTRGANWDQAADWNRWPR